MYREVVWSDLLWSAACNVNIKYKKVKFVMVKLGENYTFWKGKKIALIKIIIINTNGPNWKVSLLCSHSWHPCHTSEGHLEFVLEHHLHCATHCLAHINQTPLSQLHHHTAIRKSDLNNEYSVFVHGKQSAHRNHFSFTPLYTGGGGKLHLLPHLPWGPTDLKGSIQNRHDNREMGSQSPTKKALPFNCFFSLINGVKTHKPKNN